MNLTSTKNWKTVKLGDVASIQTGPFGSQLHESDYVQEGVPMITVEHLVNDKISHAANIPKVSSGDVQRLIRYTLETGDIVFSRVGSVDRLGLVSESENGWMFSGRLLRVRPHNIDSRFAYYALANPRNKEHIRKIAVGATMPSLNTKLLSGVPLMIPESIDEQREIADILGCLDDKIELLRNENKTLEAIAQTLFKEWFVDFNFPGATGKMTDSEIGQIPKDWRVRKLESITEITSGKRPQNISEKQNKDFNYPLIGASSVMGYVSDFLFDQEIFVIGRVGTHGIIQRFTEKIWPSDNTLVLYSKYPEFLYQILKSINFESLNKGAVQPLITQGDMKSFKIISPSEEIILEYERITGVFSSKLKINNTEIQTLSKLRDELLNKIFSK